jgi:acetolactate synthase-1/2/3 large subunit
MKNSTMTGGEAIARMLAAHEIGPMFGMGGFQLLPFYDAARRLNLQHYLINDERCGVFAADAYGKISGRVGVCDATLGPGATNLVTGLVEALNAGTPMVALVGDTHRRHSWKNMTQEARQAEILRPACKEVIRVEDIARIPELVRRAFVVATTGRPGPVALIVPEDICHDSYPFEDAEFVVSPQHRRIPAVRCRPAAADLARAAELLANARKPIMLCGGGVHLSGAAEQVQAFAKENAIPVAHTLTGKGAVACSSSLSAGLFGRYDRIANPIVAEADCVFVVGCKLGEIATKRYSLLPADKQIIHLDIVAEEFDRTTTPVLRLWGDVRETLSELQVALADKAPELRKQRSAYVADVAERMRAWRSSVQDKLNSAEKPISMARLMNELNSRLAADAILIADGGFAAHWGGLLYDTKQPGRGFVPDRGFASIGYGVPGAIGARFAAGDRPVVALTGDGGFNMVMGELETAVRLGLKFTIIIVNNAASGYVKALQHLMYGSGNYQSSDLAEVNYARVAEAIGCRGIRVEEPDDLGTALASALETGGKPTVIDVVVTRDPARMLPGVDNRTVTVQKGDRVA